MNRTQFNELVNYLKNRPAEAARLRVALGMAEGKDCRAAEALSGGQPQTAMSEQAGEWWTAKRVASFFAMSAKWVKEHSNVLPHSAVRRGARGCYLYLWNDNTRHLFTNQL